MSDRFYFPELSEAAAIEIGGSEAHHMLNVMRLTEGAEIELFDGSGHQAVGVVERITRKSLQVRVDQIVSLSRELSVRVVMGVALPRGDRARFLVEKLTELGVATLVPLIAGRSTARSTGSSVAKLERYVIEASKQCGRNQLMQIQDPTRIEDFLAQSEIFESGIVLDPFCDSPLVAGDLGDVESRAGCIGPEGGWTDSELALMTRSGWQLRNLGDRILRTETAAMALASVWSTLARANG